jgi:hypothetical protein
MGSGQNLGLLFRVRFLEKMVGYSGLIEIMPGLYGTYDC